jgi:transcriptional regulator GlxA family with amidase domain
MKKLRITLLAYPRCWAMNLMTVKDLVHISSLLERKFFQADNISCRIASVDGGAVKSASGTVIESDCCLDQVHDTELILTRR